MNLTEAYIENFGVLSDYKYLPGKGFNLICGDNGTGKSTFAEFIKAMLYGMPQTRTKKQLDSALRKKYKPWNGGNWGGYICFEAKGKSYRLSRLFGDKEKEDTFLLTDLKTGLVSFDYSDNVGEELFGVDREAFGATAWISGRSMQVFANDNIHAGLGKSMEFGQDIVCCERGMNRLDEAYKQYVRTGRRGMLYETEDALSALEVKRREQENYVYNLKNQIVQLKESISAKENSKSGKSKKLEDHLADNVTADTSWRKRLEVLDDYFSKGIPDEGRINKLVVDNEVECRKILENVERQKKVATNAKMMFFFALVAAMVFATVAVMGYVIGEQVQFWFLMILAGMAVFFVCLSVLSCILRKKSKREAEKSEEQCNILECEKERYLNELKLVREYNELSHKEEAYIEYERELANNVQRQKLAGIEREYEASIEALHTIMDDMAHYRQQLSEYGRRTEIIDKARKYLASAREIYVSEYKDSVATRMSEYLEVFDKKIAEAVQVDAELVISVMKGAEAKNIDYFSTGYKDIMWFCERLAVIEAIYGEEKPPLILDDAFLTFDESMLKKALGILLDLSESVQVIYMTCRSSDSILIKNKK